LAEISALRVRLGEPLPKADRDRLAGVAAALHATVCRIGAARTLAVVQAEPRRRDADPEVGERATAAPAAGPGADPDDKAARKLAAYAALSKYGPYMAKIAREAGVPRTTLYSWPDFMEFVHQARREAADRKQRYRFR
jgi:hypothetical protein